jgi:exonuclease III
MRVLIWNIRGFGRRGRRNQLRDYLRTNKLDILFLQETIRQDFTLGELDSLEVGASFLVVASGKWPFWGLVGGF